MNSSSMLSLASVLAVLAAGVELRVHDPSEESFAAYQQRYGRSYVKGTPEYARRLALFSQRAGQAEQHNARPGRLWTAATGPLADHTEEELEQLRGWFGTASKTGGHGSKGNLRRGMFLAQVDSTELPEQVLNWTTLNTLKTAREQGSCGSCWAVASSTVLDCHAEIYKSQQRSFSAQELVSCVPNPQKCGGTGGCAGATVELAMDYAITHGMKTEEQDPYLGVNGNCPKSLLQHDHDDVADLNLAAVGIHTATDSNAAGLSIMGSWERLPENKYEPLLRAVYERGPVAISVDASPWSSYSRGIFDSCSKDATINHAVVLIGYGKDDSLDRKFWVIENSWGPDWGENGRIRLLRQDEDEEYCGVDHQPQDGTGCKGGPEQVKVCGQCGILYDNVVPHFPKQV